MTQGRKPSTEGDSARTLFEPAKESSGLTSHATPVPATEPEENAEPITNLPATPTSFFGALKAGDTAGEEDVASGDLPSSGLPVQFESGSSLMPGQVLFDRYIVERELGRGGMGIVVLVRHRELGSERALKLILSGIARDEQARLRFRREARILDRLNHPNAVRVYDARMGKDVAFIEMEYVRGSSLNQVLTPGVPMPLDWVVDLLDQLCSVLQAASDEGIIHRDLKPQNLMLVEGRPPGTKILKLLDFGIAKIREGADDVRTLTGSFMGTPLYSSPEQIVGEKVDSRSDIYSVGLILCELLTGFKPFEGSMNAIIYKHTMVPPPTFAELNPDAAIPPQVEDVVRMCLAKEPGQRPQSLRELAERFHQAIDGSGVALNTQVGTIHKPAGLTQTFETKLRPRRAVPVSGRLIAVLMALSLLTLLLVFIVPQAKTPLPPATPPKVAGSAPSESTPKAVQIASDEEYSKQVGIWKRQGYKVDETPLKSPAGWPMALIREADNILFQRHLSGIYLPKGYEPINERPGDKPPRTLERRDGPNEAVKFIWIAGGVKFRLGSLRSADSPPDESQPGPIVVLSGFYMQETEVSNGEIEPFLNRLDPKAERFSQWRKNYLVRSRELTPEVARKLAASNISWRIAAEYASEQGGRLPTEAQWEYAARSQGLLNRFVWGNQEGPMSEVNIGYGPHREPNVVKSYEQDVTTQGIFDLTGNVQEWCRDVWKDDVGGAASQPLENPQNPPRGAAESDSLKMVVRGGAFETGAEYGQTIFRSSRNGGDVTPVIGFRIVLECPEGPPDSP